MDGAYRFQGKDVVFKWVSFSNYKWRLVGSQFISHTELGGFIEPLG
jgi:hypothetical protein